MRSLILGLLSLLLAQGWGASAAWAENCPLQALDSSGQEVEVEAICNAIDSFNQKGVPGVILADDDDDECDGDDPTWMPRPPYSALITVDPSGFGISRLNEDEEYEIVRAIKDGDILDDFREIGSSSVASLDRNSNVPSEMRYVAQLNSYSLRAISNGRLVYYFLRHVGY